MDVAEIENFDVMFDSIDPLIVQTGHAMHRHQVRGRHHSNWKTHAPFTFGGFFTAVDTRRRSTSVDDRMMVFYY